MSVSKRVLEGMLRFMARVLLRKYHPVVIGVTGSVGKSSTKEAIAVVLSRKYRVRSSLGNYNNELGVPLTILGARSGGRSLLAWVAVGMKWLSFALLPREYPEVLVLEMGIDRPGDMDYLLSVVPVNIGVFTQVSESHEAYFGSLGNIAKEKGKLITNLPVSGFAILNADDARVMRLREKTKAKVITFGLGEGADVRAEYIAVEPEARLVKGLSLKMDYHGKSLPIRLPKIVARHQVFSVLAAAAVGVALRVNPVEMVDALAAFEPLPGRMRLLPGAKESILLDDTYNASPVSTAAALETMGELQAGRKIVCLGDMLEIGAASETRHRALAPLLVEAGVEEAILVGQGMHFLFEELIKQGFPKLKLTWFSESTEAALFAASLVREGDLVLVKGSQGVRMERVSEKLLFDPAEAATFLCRQSATWKQTSFTAPEEWTAPIDDRP